MAYKNLDEFIIRLEQSRELLTTSDATRLNWSQLVAHVQTQSRAVCFTALNGSAFPVITHLYGNARRTAWALNVDQLNDITTRLSRLIDPSMPLRLGEIMARAGDIFSALRSTTAPAHNTRAIPPCQHTVILPGSDAGIDVNILPVFDTESGRMLPNAQVLTGAQGYSRVGVADVEILAPSVLVFHPPPHLILAPRQPVALVFGGDPAQIWASQLCLPTYASPYLLAGWLRTKPVPLARGVSQPVDVPANADFVLEGVVSEIDSHGRAHLTLTALTHGESAIFPVYLPTEWTRKAHERLSLPIARFLLDEIADLHLSETDTIIVGLQRQYPPGTVHKVAFGLWALTLTLHCRKIIVVSHGVDVHHPQAVAEAQSANVRGEQDYLRVGQTHLCVDATRKNIQ